VRLDIGILGGRIVDGTGNPWYYGDIGIKGKRIAKIGRIDRKDCGRAIGAKGLYVCPGFVDIHTHSDITAIVFPGCDSTLRQGVTTHLIGNCGMSAAPIGRTRRSPNFPSPKVVVPAIKPAVAGKVTTAISDPISLDTVLTSGGMGTDQGGWDGQEADKGQGQWG